MLKVLCIDESSESLAALCFALSGEYLLEVCADPDEACILARVQLPDVVILEPLFNTRSVDIPDLISRLRSLPSRPCIIILHENPPLWFCDNLRRWGAYAFISKPWSTPWLRKKIFAEFVHYRDERERQLYSSPSPALQDFVADVEIPHLLRPALALPGPSSNFAALCGSSVVMENVRKVLSLFASESKPVLLRGDTGTGKTVAAQLLHRASPQGTGPFVTRNVAAIPDSLAYAELFGCEQGAFTGASKRKGCVAEAEGGTLFLDEIGDASPDLQMTLLRFVDSGCYQPLGCNQGFTANVRLVCATNRPLEAMVRNNTFRMDLWYRLRVFSITLPPLDSHREDIPELIEFWCRQTKVNPRIFDGELVSWLSDRHWEGNVREFFNVLDRFRVLLRLKGQRACQDDFRQIAEAGWINECDENRGFEVRG